MRARLPRVIRSLYLTVATSLMSIGCATHSSLDSSVETQERVRVAATTMNDALVVDCQLPGRLMALGAQRQYLASGPLQRLTAIDCRTRGGEYSIDDLSSGTLSLKRWQPLAQQGDPQAQYYVARIYANGMGGVPFDYRQAAEWYGRAAKQHFKPAMQELGFLYESGLGVTEDRLLALNLEREGSGLGDELDYAWKLTVAKDEAAKQAADLSRQLEASNTELAVLRDRLSQTQEGLMRSRASLGRAENAVLQLHAQLKIQQSNGAETVKVKELAAKLAADEQTLEDARAATDKLRAEAVQQQTELESRLHDSQAASLELNEVLSARVEESKSARARLAQSEQRLIAAQQELSDLRLDYRRQVDQVAAQRDMLDQARAKAQNNDAAAAYRAVKDREFEVQALRVQDLEGELAKLRAAQSDARARATQSREAEVQSTALQAQLSDQQARYADQSKQLQAMRNDMAALRSKSQTEQASLFNQMSEQLSVRTADLTVRQRRLETVESDTAMLRAELAQLRTQRAEERTASSDAAARTQLALRTALEKIADQRDEIDQVRTDAARERAAVIVDRNNLQQQLAEGRRLDERDINALTLEIKARQAVIVAKDERIAAMEKKLAETPRTVSSGAQPRTVDGRGDPGGDTRPALPVGSATFYALVIGNSNYRHITAVSTPTKDASSVGNLLEQRYGFKVTRLLDATADDIMRALDNYSIQLKENDRLLIYYAGHGNSQVGPPERAFWLGVDADPRTETGWIPAESVSNKIKQINAKHVLLVSDSCFSSSITHALTTTLRRNLSDRRLQIEWNRRARMVLMSGEETPTIDNSGDQNHSRFAAYFLSVLSQNEGLMSGEMLSYEMASRMQAASQSGRQPTYSSLQDANHENGDFFFLPASVQVASLVN